MVSIALGSWEVKWLGVATKEEEEEAGVETTARSNTKKKRGGWDKLSSHMVPYNHTLGNVKHDLYRTWLGGGLKTFFDKSKQDLGKIASLVHLKLAIVPKICPPIGKNEYLIQTYSPNAMTMVS